jgi:riboflavin biosynthesis pyrimidine reductase
MITMLPARAIIKYSLLVGCGVLMAGNLVAQKLIDSIVTYYYLGYKQELLGRMGL